MTAGEPDHLERLIRDVPDFPKPGIVFKDISPLLADHDGFTAVVARARRRRLGRRRATVVDKVVGIEARGFILGRARSPSRSVRASCPCARPASCPAPTHAVSYALEYGEATLEIHPDAIAPGERVLVVDDVLATGGTVAATRQPRRGVRRRGRPASRCSWSCRFLARPATPSAGVTPDRPAHRSDVDGRPRRGVRSRP